MDTRMIRVPEYLSQNSIMGIVIVGRGENYIQVSGLKPASLVRFYVKAVNRSGRKYRWVAQGKCDDQGCAQVKLVVSDKLRTVTSIFVCVFKTDANGVIITPAYKTFYLAKVEIT